MGYKRCNQLTELCTLHNAPNLKSGQMLILYALCHCEIDTTKQCKISIAGIRNLTHLTIERHIKEHLRELKALGLISWGRQNEDLKNNHKTISFTINIDVDTLSKTEWWKGERPDPTPVVKSPTDGKSAETPEDKPDPTTLTPEQKKTIDILVPALAARLMELYGVNPETIENCKDNPNDKSNDELVQELILEKILAIKSCNNIINHTAFLHEKSKRTDWQKIKLRMAFLMRDIKECQTNHKFDLTKEGTKLFEEINAEHMSTANDQNA